MVCIVYVVIRITYATHTIITAILDTPATDIFIYCSEHEMNKRARPELVIHTKTELSEFVSDKYAEVYLRFFAMTLEDFDSCVKHLESDSVTIANVYFEMSSLRSTLRTMHSDKFIGCLAQRCLDDVNADADGDADAEAARKSAVVDDLCKFYASSLQYLEKWYDFSVGCTHKAADVLNLTGTVTFDRFYRLADSFGISAELDADALYREFCILREALVSPSKLSSIPREMYVDRWVEFFTSVQSSAKPCPNLLKIVQYGFAIECSNAFCERVFSSMKLLWRDERNQLDIETVRAELFICFNFDQNCVQFAHTVRSGKELLNAARSSDKYKPRTGK